MKQLLAILVACRHRLPLALSFGTAIVLTNRAHAAPATVDSTRSESLGDQLMDGIGADLFNGWQDPGTPTSTKEPAPAPTPLETHQMPVEGTPLFRKWSDRAGEDVGRSDGRSPLDEIIGGMRSAQELIRQDDSSARTKGVQQKIVADLDALIKALLNRQRQSEQSAPQDSPQQSRRSQTSTGVASADGQGGQTAAEDSTARLDSGEATRAQTGDVPDLLKELWGHLPQRVREQLLQSPADEFLPKYELELERYFRRLAEEGTGDAQQQ